MGLGGDSSGGILSGGNITEQPVGDTSTLGQPSSGGVLAGILGGGGQQGGSQNTAQLLGLVQQLLHPNYPSFGGSFPGGVTLAGGRTSPLQFGAPSVGKESTPGERLAILMRSLG